MARVSVSPNHALLKSNTNHSRLAPRGWSSLAKNTAPVRSLSCCIAGNQDEDRQYKAHSCLQKYSSTLEKILCISDVIPRL